MQKWDLCDLHSRHNLGESQITHWQNTQVGVVGSRIDYIFVNNQIATLFSETQLQVCSFSDHLGVTSKMKVESNVARGKGLWKMNCSVLGVKEVWEAMQEVLGSVQDQLCVNTGRDAFDLWGEAKSIIQAASIFYAQKLANGRRRQESFLEGKLRQLNCDYMEGSLSSSDWIKECQSVKEELSRVILYKVEGYAIRGKVKWLEEGEKPSSYFHRLIRAWQVKLSMVKVKCGDGSIVTRPDGILGEARQFYQRLYSRGVVSADAQDEILQSVQSSLTLNQQSDLEKPIELQEVLSAIQEASSQSSPGKDGIPYGFYKRFKKEIAPILVQIYNEVLGGKSLKPGALESVIILIYKNKGSEEELKNWRPISLLNCDLKILTKILAKRLQTHIASIIHEDQAGFVSGRLIQDNCMMVGQILECNRISPVVGGLYFLDQEKAYD